MFVTHDLIQQSTPESFYKVCGSLITPVRLMSITRVPLSMSTTATGEQAMLTGMLFIYT